VVLARRLDDQSVDPPGGKRGNQLPLAFFQLVRAAREDEYASLDGHVLDGPMKRGRERVGNIFEDDADRGASAVQPAQAARGQVVPVRQPLGGGGNAPGKLWRHAGFAVHDSRNGLDADLGKRCDLPHRGPRFRRQR
jgi:hypothetical protein